MTTQIEEDLHLMKHTLLRANINWEKWCHQLPPLKDVRYSLVKRDGTIVCDSLDKTQEGKKVEELSIIEESSSAKFASELRKSSFFGTQAVFASMRLGQDLIIRKVIPVTSLRDNMDRFDRVLFLRIVPFALISYFVFIFLFYRSTKPLGIILSKVEKFKDDIPFNKSLELLYERDEWGSIEEALNKADLRLQKQILEVQIENEKNTAILESINDDIIAVDRYESILFYNSKFRKDFMARRDGQEINKKVWHLFDDEVLNAFRTVLTTGQPQSLKGISFPQSNNPGRIFDLTITPLNSPERTVNGALGVFYDVTEFKLAEQMRVDFVANVSHEIRTPLTSIKGFTQILQGQSTKVDATLHPFLEKIVANTERMISLFNDLLNLSVIESRNYLRPEEFPLPEIVEGIEGNIKASYPDKKIEFESDIQLEYIKGDFRLIEQVILNLCDNACKYSGDAVKITVSSYQKDENAVLEIKDNGPGIAKEHLSRIFERFYRIDASRESLRGTGLGLAIVKQIVSKHKGKIWAESEGAGKGTKFVIELPLE
jgi:two-component system phosphate regulon sensor histidine kinase PhoR